MEESIIIQSNPTELVQTVYIISNASETIPLVRTCTMEEMPSVVAMNAAKFGINYIKLAGPKSYTSDLRNILMEKINTCFGKENNFTIELM